MNANATRCIGLVGTLALLCSSVSCKREAAPTDQVTEPITAEQPKTAECAACSMVVREQPAPRGQVVHRDGTRRFFCALSDLVQYLHAPSAHGEPNTIFVELLDPGMDPHQTPRDARPWVDAEQAIYVVGIDRKRVMGRPGLAYRTRSEAEQIAKKYGGRVLDFESLKAALLK